MLKCNSKTGRSEEIQNLIALIQLAVLWKLAGKLTSVTKSSAGALHQTSQSSALSVPLTVKWDPQDALLQVHPDHPGVLAGRGWISSAQNPILHHLVNSSWERENFFFFFLPYVKIFSEKSHLKEMVKFLFGMGWDGSTVSLPTMGISLFHFSSGGLHTTHFFSTYSNTFKRTIYIAFNLLH